METSAMVAWRTGEEDEGEMGVALHAEKLMCGSVCTLIASGCVWSLITHTMSMELVACESTERQHPIKAMLHFDKG